MNRLLRPLALLAGLALAAAGCKVAPSQADVHGEVTLDDEPVKEGIIRFLPADKKLPPGEAVIKDGRYACKAPPGKVRVDVRSLEVVEKRNVAVEGPGTDKVRERIPERYNDKTELEFEIRPGDNDLPLRLQSK